MIKYKREEFLSDSGHRALVVSGLFWACAAVDSVSVYHNMPEAIHNGIGIFSLGRSNFVSLTLIFAVVFWVLYTIRSIYIGISIIFHERYQDDMTLQENRRYTD